MTSMDKFNKGLEDFEKEVEQELMDVSRLTSKAIYIFLVNKSPKPKLSADEKPKKHVSGVIMLPQRGQGDWSLGRYIQSHRIAADKMDPFDYVYWPDALGKDFGAKNKAFSMADKYSKAAMKKPYQKTIVYNASPHGQDVEYGNVAPGTWRFTGGYYPFEHASYYMESAVKMIIKNVQRKKQ